jgi:sugar O-acyltransferase (sialic acid O-acetyltransferase NeuD family)
MTRRLVVIGAGGFGREVLDVIEAINDAGGTTPLEVVGVLDDGDPDPELLRPYGVSHLGPVSSLAQLDEDVEFVVAIGDPAVRRTVDHKLRASGRGSPVLVHPTAWVGRREVALGPGTIVCANVSITNHVTLGRHVHVNLNSTIGHDAVIDDYVTLSPLVAISGNVYAGECAFFGSGATVNPLLRIGERVRVGSGAAVVKDVDADQTVVGVPARRLPV